MALMTTVGLQFIVRDRSRQGIRSFRANITGLTRSVMQLAGVGGGMYMLVNMLRSGVREGAAFEKQMSMVSTMLDEQSMSLMPRYAQQMRAMSKQFGEGTETLSKGLYDILSASFAPTKAMKMLAVSVKSAKAGMTDTAIAADAITTILNSYRLRAERASDVSDKLFAIVKRGKTTFAELAPNIGKVAALAATAGLSFDDLGASITTMTRAGVQTQIAMTSLRAIVLSFLKPMPASIALAKKYNVELNSLTLRTEGLTGVIQKLKKATAEELAIIVPTSRAITGFAAAIQNADAQADDYKFILNSLGETETAYQKIADDSAFKLDQLSQEWIDMKRAAGDLMIEPLTGFLKDVTWAIDRLTENLKGANKAFTEFLKNYDDLVTRYKLAPSGKQTYGRFGGGGGPLMPKTAPASQGSALEDFRSMYQRDQALAMMAALQMQQYGPEAQSVFATPEIKAPKSAGTDGAVVALNAEQQRQIVADTRAAMEAVRHQDYLTRMERLESLRQYKEENQATLSQVEAASKALDSEIRAIERSRVDQMKMYSAELREDAQHTALYISEKYAQAARANENSMGNMFYNMMMDSKNWRDHLRQYCKEVLQAFARMIAQMIARWIMYQTVTRTTGGASRGGYTAGSAVMHGGGTVGVGTYPQREIPAWMVAVAPRYKEGRWPLRPNENVAVLHDDETVLPPGVRPGGTTVVVNNYVSAIDGENTARFFSKNQDLMANLMLDAMTSGNHPLRRYRG